MRGFGHLQRACQNQVLIYVENHKAHLATVRCDEEEKTLEDVVNEGFWQATPMFEAEKEHKGLILSKALMATPHQTFNKGIICLKIDALVNGKLFSVIVDSGSSTNVCAYSMIDDAKNTY